MKVPFLSRLDKANVTKLAQSLAARALKAASEHPLTEDPDNIYATDLTYPSEPWKRLEEEFVEFRRYINLQMGILTASVERLQKRTAIFEGDLESVRQALAQLESKLEDQSDDFTTSAATYAERVSNDLSIGLDKLSLIVTDTATAHVRLMTLAAEIAQRDNLNGRSQR